jgi:2-oxo-4-hydroxy-4-carboxy-5-ureidoimidazoline decarboxylase
MPTTLASLNAFDRAGFVSALGHLFEHSPWVADETYAKRPFRGADELFAALCATMRAAPLERQLELLKAHPDLAGRLAQAGALTASSAREQSAAGLDRLPAAEADEIRRLNEAYRVRFGFPFIICARLNAKEAILASMRARVSNSAEAELAAALGEVAKIARLRLDEVLAGGGDP